MGLNTLIDAGFFNAPLVEKLYEQYLTDPDSVDPSWQHLFAQQAPKAQKTITPTAASTTDSTTRIYHMIQAYRSYGHLLAKVNPIATHYSPDVYQLNLNNLGFTDSELAQEFPTCGLLNRQRAPLAEIIAILREIYCNKVGVEYMGLQRPEMETWLEKHIEPSRFSPALSFDQKKMILEQLNRSELFEVFLQTKYTGQKRFSLEGTETTIPVIAAILDTGAGLGMKETVIGMAHRGRLNVLTNILNKSYATIFSEFEEGYIPDSFEGSGDVKYHKGYFSRITTQSGREVDVHLLANPSHLESVDPVVEGFTRARQIKRGDERDQNEVIPILIHGDSSVAGQGVVYETLQLYNLPGYATGGTIHIVINNQIGFTTLPKDARSTHYCTDIARAFGAPVFHVNAEDPESAVYATNLAVELRQKFHCDVFIEINGYRKYGHNEGDEPRFTQPMEYKLIGEKKPIREIYRDHLVSSGVMEKKMAEGLESEFQNSLHKALEGIHSKENGSNDKIVKTKVKPDLLAKIKTAVPAKKLKDCAEKFCKIPEGFDLNRKLQRLVESRMEMVNAPASERKIDWGMGEHLAFGTLLLEGKHIRLAGQDSRRGTFSHRHAMWIDQTNAKKYFPLSRMSPKQGRFDVFNSSLSEFAAMGFEFGYSHAYPEGLVLWEGQFGDFANGAQVVIDQYISSSEQKWAQPNNLTLLLPHGYEGQGPEHSSARIERFLTLAGDNNMFICNPSTPAQIFHLLRRQAIKEYVKPLIVFTPKGLLRHPLCVSSVDDLTKGGFQEVIDDPREPKKVEKLIFCSGKVYYELLEEMGRRNSKQSMAICRVEQLYPLDETTIATLMKKYSSAKVCIWMQDEPMNMGAWGFIQPHLVDLLDGKMPLRYVGRGRSAAPATGSLALHKKQLAAMMDDIFGEKPVEINGMVAPKAKKGISAQKKPTEKAKKAKK